MNRHQAVRPLLILPGGIYVTERDVSRFTLSPRTKARIQGMLMFLGFLLLCALASFDGVTPQ